MAAGDDVIVRHTPGTTTYHFGRTESICEEVPADDATTMTLNEALGEGRRLCVLCGRLIEKWVGYSTAVASATSLMHPDR